MEVAFRRLEAQVPQPTEIPYRDSTALRYSEQTIGQAIIIKLARIISGLHAIDVLLLNGLVQEQAVIQRTLDEFGEDVFFLSLALTTGKTSKLHEEYLEAFWKEEFDEPNPLQSTQKRATPRRKRVRSYTSREGGLNDPYSADVVGETISKTYSGYVHAAAPQVMDMCLGDPPQFQLRGMRGTIRMQEHAQDGWNHFYRGLLACCTAAKGFGDGPLVEALYSSINKFEAASGTEYFQGQFRDYEKI